MLASFVTVTHQYMAARAGPVSARHVAVPQHAIRIRARHHVVPIAGGLAELVERGLVTKLVRPVQLIDVRRDLEASSS